MCPELRWAIYFIQIDDEVLIDTLGDSKKTSNIIQEKVKIAEATILISNEIIFKLDVSKFLNDQYFDLEILKLKSVRKRLREKFQKKQMEGRRGYEQ